VIFECVINVSQGRDEKLLDNLSKQFQPIILDVHRDFDHHRSVFTFVSKKLEELELAVKEFVDLTFTNSNYVHHDGVHPNFGFIDVVPFVSYNEINRFPTLETIDAAIRFGEWVNNKFEVDVSYYEHASKNKISLPQLRKNLAARSKSYLVSSKQVAEHGQVCVGARQPLIAINVNLDTQDPSIAKEIASQIRESSGGIKNVRALCFELISQNKTQVSMNVIDALETNAGSVTLKIKQLALENGIASEVELVGLVPNFQFEQWSDEFLAWSRLDASVTVESKLRDLEI